MNRAIFTNTNSLVTTVFINKLKILVKKCLETCQNEEATIEHD